MLKEGHVIWIKFRFNNRPGDVSETEHPYVVVNIDENINTVELIQIDSIEGKLHKAYLKENMFIRSDGESVLQKDGFAQLDNCFQVENSSSLDQYKRTEDTLSPSIFQELKRRYNSYQMRNYISENKTVYLSIDELEEIN